MQVLVATDAWDPQVNGVVFSLKSLAGAARAHGVEVNFVTPSDFATLPLPTYPEIRLAAVTAAGFAKRIAHRKIDHIHVATEGPIGWAARSYCLSAGLIFTTSFHTRFPEYVRARFGVPESLTYAWLRRFHNAAGTTMVATESLVDELRRRGFQRLSMWSRGVDPEIFRPRERSALPFARPAFLYVGRLAVEKNLEAFLSLDLPGSKVVVGDGPARASLQQTFPKAHFLGAKPHDELAPIYSSADAFVFPSKTDTFGMVLIEALACGLPIAAFPVQGPKDVLAGSDAGCLDWDLRIACLAALQASRNAARQHALKFSWDLSARQFIHNVIKAHAFGSPRQSGLSEAVAREAYGIE